MRALLLLGFLLGCSSSDPTGTDAGSDSAIPLKDAGGLKSDAIATGPACDAPSVAPSNGACVAVNADAGIACNPVTNAGCNAGESCDNDNGGFKCYAPPPANTLPLCGECKTGSSSAPACSPTSTCTPATKLKCARFCCDDGDCGSGHCDKTVGIAAGVGVCLL